MAAKTGYEVSFADFQRLISEARNREMVAPLLREWFGYEIVGDGNAAVVQNGKGSDVGKEILHATIQSDPERQSALYRTAMTLWR